MGGVVGEIQKILFFHWNSILKIFPPLGVLHHHIPTPSSGSLVHRITGGFFSELLHSPLAVLCSMRNSFLLSLTSVSSVQSLSRVWLSATPWTAACQAPLTMGFSRQEYWSRLPCPPPEDFLDSGIEPASLMSPALTGGFFTTSLPNRKAYLIFLRY